MSKTISIDPNARALQSLEKQRRTAPFGPHSDSTLIEVLADAHGTGEFDLVIGLLQEVRQTLAIVGTVVGTFEINTDTPLLENDDLETTFATLRRKLVAIEHLYFLKVASMAAAQATDVDEAAQ